ncbi:phage exclusion protein Lit family protein [Burkholderia contaminans]|uniref:phage exclusion protein Lit family protein n=1 Tax=Burkholderia contaminans TaxID=488447 RepID=UPI001CF1AB70|nr:phage exclusion protein Lit family protein [Burkholderia contaminans]MCA7916801.1 hypothetical protein [Burkholderia contaminans]UUX35765.1 phage exclusion protein Lit family protein [Burkholderia contaminans]
MHEEKRTDDEIQRSVKNLFLGIVPERTHELLGLWDSLQLQFCLLGDGKTPMMEGGAYRYVHFNHRALRVVWVSAFAAWEAYACTHAELMEGEVRTSHRLKELLKIALDVRDSDAPESVPLTGLPQPGQLPDKDAEPQLRAAAELAMFATGWAMLHEVRHLQHQQEGTSSGPESTGDPARSEEHSCDLFATTFLMRDANRYAVESDSNPDLVYQKRSIGIYFAVFALVVLGHPKWEQSDTHPSIQSRLDAVYQQISGGHLDMAACIATLAFSALQRIWPTAPNLVFKQ